MATSTSTLSNLESFHSVLDIGDAGITALQRLSGAAAFRKYSWLRNLPAKNVSGNFRGMVINSRSKSVFVFVGKAGTVMDNLAVFLSIVEEFSKSASGIRSAYSSQADGYVRSAMISSEIAAACIRVLGKVGTGFFTLGSLYLQASRYLNAVCYFGNVCSSTESVAKWLSSEKHALDTEIDTIFTGDTIYSFVTGTLR